MHVQTKQRNGTIDLMKFLFTVITMCFHSGRYFPGGYIAVEFFFIVSGYLMAQSADKRKHTGVPIGKDTFSFILHKAAGIFPFYIIAWLLSFFITMGYKDVSNSDFFMELFRSPYNIFMLEMCGNYDMGHRIQGSWYISAMLLAMLLIYPIRKKKTHAFDYVGAPILVLMFVGYVYQQKHGISMTVSYIPKLYIYNGLWRAIAEISLGCFCYRIGRRLSGINLTKLGQIILSVIELGGYILVIYMAWQHSGSDKDLALLVILALSITLSFSGKGIHVPLFSNKLFSFLGKFSLCMYLTHEVVRTVISPNLRRALPISEAMQNSDLVYFTVFFSFTFLLAFVCYLGAKLISKITPAAKELLRLLMIKSGTAS